MFLKIQFFLSLIAFFFLVEIAYSQDSETETDKPVKPKSYTERYKDFYNPQNYTKNYKDRYKPENYRRYYYELNRNHYDSYRYRSIDAEEKPLDETLFNQGKRSNALPHAPNVPLNDPTQLVPRRTQPIPGSFNPFLMQPDMIPPHLIRTATTAIGKEATSALPKTTSTTLPPRQLTREQPASLTASATLAVQDAKLHNASPDISEVDAAQAPGVPQSPAQAIPPTVNHSSPGQMLFDSGIQSFAQRNYRKAEQTFTNLVEMAPGSVYAQFAYGLALFFTTNYKNANDAFHACYQIAQEKRVFLPTLWQIQIDPRDFRFHYRKLARYVEQNPNDHEASTLLLTLSNAASNTQTAK